jgi:hypothetical protein
VTDDDRAVMERLAALEAEVKADADAQRARKETALAKVREERAKQLAERDELRSRQAALVTKKKPEQIDHADGLGGALELAGRANRVKQELERKPGKGEKSWIASGVASTALGPLGWLYAGSLREAIPAATIWIVLASIASKILPTVLLWPVLMVVMPLSGIAGVVYALQFNRAGKRTRIFGDKKEPKQLKE